MNFYVQQISKERDSLNLTLLVKSDGFINGTTLNDTLKEEAKSELKKCMKQDMPVPQPFVLEIMSDREMNARIINNY